MDYPEPGSPQGAWELPGEGGGGGYGGRYERAAGGEEEEEEEAAEHPLARPPRRPRQRSVPPLRAALSTSSSEEGEPEAATPSDSTGGGEFDSAESGASLRYSSGTGESGEGAGLASGESGGGSALPERKRQRSAAGGGRPRYEVVRELGAEEVRWFYREDRKSWKPFIGYDSLRIELAFRALGPGPERTAVEPVCVRSGLYEVDVANAECYPVYWNRECGRCRPGAPLGGGRGPAVPARAAHAQDPRGLCGTEGHGSDGVLFQPWKDRTLTPQAAGCHLPPALPKKSLSVPCPHRELLWGNRFSRRPFLPPWYGWVRG